MATVAAQGSTSSTLASSQETSVIPAYTLIATFIYLYQNFA